MDAWGRIPKPHLIDRSSDLHRHVQMLWHLSNGWGVSAVQGDHMYQTDGEPGTFEVAIVHVHDDVGGNHCVDYSTGLTDDVLREVPCDELIDIVEKVQSFPDFDRRSQPWMECPQSQHQLIAGLRGAFGAVVEGGDD